MASDDSVRAEASGVSRLSDPGFVRPQYEDSSNLDARVRLYRLYSTNPVDFTRWVFDQLDLPQTGRVLELGCGPGALWRENVDRTPSGLELTLSDLSAGMLDEARRRLAGTAAAIRFEEIDAQAIPWPDDSAAVVIANHMLYHVPDRLRALSEIGRVLVAGGRFYATTYDWTHLIEMREVAHRFGLDTLMQPPHRIPGNFDLEQGAEEVAARFDGVRVTRFGDALEVTDPEPLIDYLMSMSAERGPAEEEAVSALRAHVARQIELSGSFRVRGATGLIAGVSRR